MVGCRQVESDNQRNGLQREKPGKERPDHRQYSQPDPESEEIRSRIPRGYELRVDSDFHKNLKVRMKKSRSTAFPCLLGRFRAKRIRFGLLFCDLRHW